MNILCNCVAKSILIYKKILCNWMVKSILYNKNILCNWVVKSILYKNILCNFAVTESILYHFKNIHCNWVAITKTYLYNFDSLKPHFYMVKQGFTGVSIIFLISQKHKIVGIVRTASARRF